jgi:hypothetical protein
MRRNRFKQQFTLEERLADEARHLREAANALPPGPEKESLLRKARQDETASRMTEWLTSPGLRRPI